MKKWTAKTAHQLLLILIYIKNAAVAIQIFKIVLIVIFMQHYHLILILRL